MTIWDFRKLSQEERIDATLTEGEYYGEDSEERSIYQLSDFWVVITEKDNEYIKAVAFSEEPE